MAGSKCKSHSSSKTRSNYQPKGSQYYDDEEQKQQTRKQQQQAASGGATESVGKGPSGNGFVGGKKFYKKV